MALRWVLETKDVLVRCPFCSSQGVVKDCGGTFFCCGYCGKVQSIKGNIVSVGPKDSVIGETKSLLQAYSRSSDKPPRPLPNPARSSFGNRKHRDGISSRKKKNSPKAQDPLKGKVKDLEVQVERMERELTEIKADNDRLGRREADLLAEIGRLERSKTIFQRKSKRLGQEVIQHQEESRSLQLLLDQIMEPSRSGLELLRLATSDTEVEYALDYLWDHLGFHFPREELISQSKTKMGNGQWSQASAKKLYKILSLCKKK